MNVKEALWISIVLSGIAQILLRKGASQLQKSSFTSPRFWKAVFSSGWIWGWGGCFAIATGLWLFALSGLNISYAVPLLSASYIIVALLSRVLLDESVTLTRWAAIAVITVGVMMIARN